MTGEFEKYYLSVKSDHPVLSLKKRAIFFFLLLTRA